MRTKSENDRAREKHGTFNCKKKAMILTGRSDGKDNLPMIKLSKKRAPGQKEMRLWMEDVNKTQKTTLI